jgi:hypothetical protein
MKNFDSHVYVYNKLKIICFIFLFKQEKKSNERKKEKLDMQLTHKYRMKKLEMRQPAEKKDETKQQKRSFFFYANYETLSFLIIIIGDNTNTDYLFFYLTETVVCHVFETCSILFLDGFCFNHHER